MSQDNDRVEELEYRMAGPSRRWGEVAARTFEVTSAPPVVPFVLLSGACPVCGHAMDQPEYLDQYSGVSSGEKGLALTAAAESARIDDDIDMACGCDVAHPGLDGSRGCGRRWRIHLVWNRDAYSISSPMVPVGGDFEALARRQATARDELLRVRAAADKWRTALAGLFVLATGLLVIKGRDSIDVLVGWARYLAGGLAAIGLAVAIFAATRAMRASFGKLKLDAMFDPAGHRIDQRVHDRQHAKEACTDLRVATVCTMGALLALGAAVGVTWYAPAAPGPIHWLQITRSDGTAVCGDLLASDDGQVVLRRADTSEVVRVRLAAMGSLRSVDTCAGR